MIYAKIDNKQTKNIGSYFTVRINNYNAGANKAEVAVRYCVEKSPSVFQVVKVNHITLTSEDLSTWGTSDETLLQIVAGKENLSIIEYVTATSPKPITNK